jgi:predicted nucleic acid-binding protein
VALYYLETSALVKLYVHESGTEHLLALVAGPTGHRFVILSLAQVEFRSAVRRRERDGQIPGSDANKMIESFHRHSEGRFMVERFSDFLLDVASLLVDRHGLRAYDAMQLAGYLTLRAKSGIDTPIFVCADKKLLDAAQLEHSPVLDPSSS